MVEIEIIRIKHRSREAGLGITPKGLRAGGGGLWTWLWWDNPEGVKGFGGFGGFWVWRLGNNPEGVKGFGGFGGFWLWALAAWE